MGKLNQKVRKKRRLRIDRCILLIIILIVACFAIGFLIKGVYAVGQNAYQFCQNISQDYQKRMSFQAKFQSEKFKNYTNILLIGVDDGDIDNAGMAKRADALMMMSINHETGSLEIVSIPRDTYVNIPGRNTLGRIAQAYSYGETQLTVRTVEELLKIPINHYIVVDWDTFVGVIDTLGGIDLYVENDMYYEDPYANLVIDLKKGFQHLDGVSAGKYVRYRSDDLADIGRVQRHQRILKAIYTQALHVDAIVKIPEIFDIINKNVTTSLSAFDVAKIIKYVDHVSQDSIRTQMIPGDLKTMNNENVWVINEGELNRLLDQIFIDNDKIKTE
ncbi:MULTISPECIES: LCP family protein [Anaerosinus]|uniref:LCP family protein n=1 Tax=Selenobaculum gibii TaxID=3054208 RepID=A0A9Y2AIF3_9FIRM|nr:LCP family protein [Selenobaculum gbiensis]WIW71424.1 LCP family protein [Selenobaculum gbiensis]